MQNVIKSILVWGIILIVCQGLCGCKGGKIPEIGGINGPDTIDEYENVEFWVSLTNASDATFLWSCDPADAGKFDDPDFPKTGFTASMVTQDIPVKISIIIESQQFEPVILSKSITVKDTGPYGWARTWGGPGWDTGYGIAVDGNGNAYITGTFSDTVDFDPGVGVDEHTSIGDSDIFLSKFNSNGEFRWAHTFDVRTSAYGHAVAVDGSGNICITGNFYNTVDFDPGSEVNEHTSNGGLDVFCSKFDSSGAFQWARTWGGSSSDHGNGVATDASGNAYVLGYFYGTVDFDPGLGVDEHTSHSVTRDIFLSKFNTSGELLWTITWGSYDAAYDHEVAIDGNDNVYVTGSYYGTVDFDPGLEVDEHISYGHTFDIFLSKFDSNGEFQWALTWGGPFLDGGYGVASDGGGNIYVTGCFDGNVDFNPGQETVEYISNGERDVFLCKFDSNGEFQWACTWGGASNDVGYNVAVDGNDNVYVTGNYSGTVDFDPGLGVDEHISYGNISDVFLSKFNSSGELLWALTWGGYSCDRSFGIAVDGIGNSYVTGDFRHTVDFDPGPGIDEQISHSCFQDIFLSKFPPDGNW